MYPVISVADEILKIAKRAGKSLTPLQLMKLTYIAHGWSLGLYNKDLFNARIEAWKYGPVIPDLYRATKQYGRGNIPTDLIDVTSSSVDENTRKFLEWVFAGYGNLDGIQLSSLTHKSGTPWDQVYRDGVMKIEIGDDLIKDHYRKLAHERNYVTTAS
ncbi:hypothetical protein D3C87_988840 [compost metagenome]